MAQVPVSPVVLIILDGWGHRESADGNAVAAANIHAVARRFDVVHFHPQMPFANLAYDRKRRVGIKQADDV